MRVRSLFAAAVLTAAPLVPMAFATPAHALAAGHTICYDGNGNPVMDPADPTQFTNCYTRPGGGGTTVGGGGGPVVCDITVTDQTPGGPESGTSKCGKLKPLQG
jgi:hypothetical protein